MWGVHEYCATLPVVFTPACACPLHVATLHLCSDKFPVDLDSLVDSLVTCQRLTSLELSVVTLSLQSLLAVLKGLHNLRALGLEWVSDKRVSDGV